TYFYAVLTSRDQKILEQSGINKNNLFLLSNPVEVTTFKDTNQRDESSCSKIRKRLGLKDDLPIMLYPVRAIRRKNIGEILLLSALFSGKAYWIITREPKNPLEKPIYEKWVKYAKREHLSVVFNADEKVDFAELYETAFKVVVTSVTEGFGLAFLEPWIRGKAVTGRNIPDITSDFKNEGIKLDSLYSVLSIPVSSLSNLSRLETEYSVFLQDIYASYAIEIANGTIKEFLQKKLKEKTIDFADLDILEQQYIISEIKRSPELRETIIKENNLKMILKNPCKKTIEYNKKRIKAVFNLKNYGKKLNKIYLQMLKIESTENAHLQDPAEKLIENFTNAKNIRLIKQ
ncbi:MAG: hypothetical protein U9O87_04510, partial [Verrucomicrobiota bacterium]|nr:hypothetical protein [Verrucomicrobiota bacterium]